MIRKLFVILGCIGIIVAFAFAIWLLGELKPKPEQQEAFTPAPAVFVQSANYEDVRLSVMAQGEVRPRTEINLSSQIGGKIVQVADNFIDGGIINEGDILLKLEDADYKVAVARARAQLAQAEQGLRLEEAEGQLARQDWEELGGLESGESPSDLTLRKPQLAQAKANFDAAKADLANAQLNLSRTVVKAPFTGRVRSRSADLGQFISPGAPLGQIFSTDVAEIRLPLSDNDLLKLGLPIAFVSTSENPGAKVNLSSTVAGRTHNWTGSIVRTDAAYDPSTRQIAAIAAVKDPYGAGADNGFPLAVGLFVSAEIEGQEVVNAVVVPRLALTEGNSVFVVNPEDRLVLEKPVSVAAVTERGVIISNGVLQDDLIITSRIGGIVPGMEVTPLDQKGEKLFEDLKKPKTDKPEDEDDQSGKQAAATKGGQ